MHRIKGFTVIELIILIAIIVLFFAILLPGARLINIPIEYSYGSRTGIITKMSHKGFFVKTWEGEMNLGGMTQTGEKTTIPTIFEFSVPDDNLAKQIQKISKEGKKITLFYSEKIAVGYWIGDTDYLIIGIENADDPNQ